MTRWTLPLAALIAGCGGGSGEGESPASDVPAASPAAAAGAEGGGAVAQGLVLVANLDEAPLHLLPSDWADLFHFRFADEVLTLSPESSPEVRAFMAGVIQAETRRAGTVEAGLDWLRRFDTSVLTYEDDANDVRYRLRQGHAWLALLPASEAGPLLEREGFGVVPLESGFDPTMWEFEADFRGGSESGSSDAPEGTPEIPPVPDDWLARWTAEVRGRG